MTTLPAWIEDRIDPTLEKKLTQRHVVEVMLEAEARSSPSSNCRRWWGRR